MENVYTRSLAEYIAGSTFEAIPAHVVAHIKLLVLDTLGTGLLGAAMPWSERLRATLAASEAPGDAAVWGTPLRFSAPSAAMANATAVHGFELDDVGAGGHNGSVTLTTALALAQHRGGISGAALIDALVAGYETSARVSRCVGRIPHEGLGFHGPGLMGTFAAVAAGAKALKLDAGAVVHALGHAGQQAASLMFTHHGGMGKRLLAGQAARGGTFGALLAAHGFTNADNVFEAEYGGFCAAHTGNRGPERYDLTQLTRELGSAYHCLESRIKLWACRVPCHPTLEGLREIRRRHPVPPHQVAAVRIRLGRGSLQNVGWAYHPATVASAQLNLHYVAAIMLLENDVFLEQFSEAKIRAPEVLEMVRRITILHDPDLDDAGWAAGNPVQIELTDGTRLEAWGHARGTPERPIPREDVVAKFRKTTAAALEQRAQDALIERCDRLETLPDATELLALLPTGVRG